MILELKRAREEFQECQLEYDDVLDVKIPYPGWVVDQRKEELLEAQKAYFKVRSRYSCEINQIENMWNRRFPRGQ